MSILNTIRSHEWWEYKLPPLLAIYFATALIAGVSISDVAVRLVCIFIFMTVGIVYVSLINDVTDIEEDLACGKSNRMANVKPAFRWIFPLICVLVELGAVYYIREDLLSVAFCCLAWISFSLYSIPPVRLKKRGALGVIADACGAHLFPGLFMITHLSYYIGQPINLGWFAAVAVWSLSYGLRGILWHQFYDRKKDIESGVTTFAVSRSPRLFKRKEQLLTFVELTALSIMLYFIALPMVFIFLLLYILLIIWRYTGFHTNVIMIVFPEDQPYQILMAEFYQVFLPLSLLISDAIMHSGSWLIVAFYLFMFPNNLKIIISDVAKLTRKTIFKEEI